MLVKEMMNPGVVSIQQEDSVALAARLLSRHNVGVLPVCGQDGRLRGGGHGPGYRAAVRGGGGGPGTDPGAADHDPRVRVRGPGGRLPGGDAADGRTAGAAAAGGGPGEAGGDREPGRPGPEQPAGYGGCKGAERYFGKCDSVVRFHPHLPVRGKALEGSRSLWNMTRPGGRVPQFTSLLRGRKKNLQEQKEDNI